MKTLFSRIILALSLLGFISTASALDVDYPQSGPIFSESAYLVGGVGEVDTFYFNNQYAGTYHFYSTGAVDTYGYIYSDTYSSTLASNDDGAAFFGGFCVEATLLANEAITIYVEGWSASSEGSYTVVGASGTCNDSGYYFSNSNQTAPISGVATSADAEASAFSLPVVLFSLLGLAAVRLRRFFA